MNKIYLALFLSAFSILISPYSFAANLTMNELAGKWVVKKKIMENGDTPLDAHGMPSGKKEIVTDNCEITPINTASGYLKCGDEIFQIDILKKKLILTPLAYAPYNGFIKTLEQSWNKARYNIFSDGKTSYTNPKLSGPVYVTKISPLKIVNQNKLINGAIRLEADFTGQSCYTFNRNSLTCQPFTVPAVYDVKYLSLTR